MLRLRLDTLIMAAGLVLPLASVAYGQSWEVGAGGGASFYNSNTITGGAADVTAKFHPGYGFNAFFSQIGNRIGGEIDYTWLSNEMELNGGGRSFTMGGHSQALHYDVVLYFSGKESKLRPYVLAGGGIKQYSGTGPSDAVQPLGNLAVLTSTSEWKPLVVAGGGLRYAVSAHMQVRGDVRMMLTQAPSNVITPVTGNLDSWYFDIVPMVSLSYVW